MQKACLHLFFQASSSLLAEIFRFISTNTPQTSQKMFPIILICLSNLLAIISWSLENMSSFISSAPVAAISDESSEKEAHKNNQKHEIDEEWIKLFFNIHFIELLFQVWLILFIP